MKSPSSTVNAVIVICVGLFILAGYFIPGLDALRESLLGVAIVLASFALLVGVVNLLSVHLRKVIRPKSGGVYSLVLILSFLITVAVMGISGLKGSWSLWIFNNIQIPVESSLLAIMAITLAYTSLRLLRRRPGWFALVFIITALTVLLSAAPLYMVGYVPLLRKLGDWIAAVPAVAGARGILIGVALGAVATGLRILMGADRPYGSS